ncbi:aldose 1-epimerase family protein [Litorihabitans aurantiacus]|uniref:aldose 1-epimerase family protein n=1 Tax=Litorihabitans aurantiacus TaxID=1930061 RepID=UPI0024E082BF|nr:aldose 1-epimerase family protein [Litorihabitans aurantiacus]
MRVARPPLGWSDEHPPPTGFQHVLHDPETDATAVVTQVGASLRSFTVAGRDVISSYPESDLAPAGHGAILAPWPNRLADGAYTFDGVSYQLPITEVERRTALHGLVTHQRWDLAHASTTEVVLSLQTVPVAGYPWSLLLTVTYTLSGPGLAVTVHASNLSDSPAPYGVGFHPWLSPGEGGLEDATFSLDATRWIRPDERLLPVGEEDLPQHLDFRSARAVGTTDIDDAFTGITRDGDGLSWGRLTGTDGRTAAIWTNDSMDTWQVCTGDHLDAVEYRRQGLAVEPMSCIADAFNTGDRLVRLAPAGGTDGVAQHVVTWGLRLL